MDCTDLTNGERAQFREEHLMRYLFPAEIEALGAAAGLRLATTEEFLTGRPPSADTWGVAYLMKKIAG